MNARKAGLGFILVTLFLDVLGIGLAVPVLPRLVGSFHSGEGETALTYGLFMAAYAGMQFLFSPLIGCLSDRFGRRPLLLTAVVGQGLDYILLAVAPDLWWLLTGRLIAGITGASIGTATAYIADVSPPEKRAQNFGLIGMAFGLGFIAGPALGAWLGQTSLRLPFVVAAVLCLANAVYGLLVLPESLPPEQRRPFDLRRANPLGSLAALRRFPAVTTLAAVQVLLFLAQRGLESVWVLYTSHRYGWDVRATGTSLACVGLSVAIVQGGLVRRILPRLGERKSLLGGILLTVLGFVLYALAAQGWMIYAVLCVSALGGIAGPTVQGIISRSVPADEQGRLQGAITSLQGLASIIAPLLATQLFAAFSSGAAGRPYVPGAPFLVGALLQIVAFGLAVRAFEKRDAQGAASTVQA